MLDHTLSKWKIILKVKRLQNNSQKRIVKRTKRLLLREHIRMVKVKKKHQQMESKKNRKN